MSGVQRYQLLRSWAEEIRNWSVMAVIIVGEEGYRTVLGILYRVIATHLVEKAGRTHRTPITVALAC